jgi:hypothetical protein
MDMTTLTLTIIANAVLDVALLGLLAFVMSRAGRLTPHRPGITGNAWHLRRPLRHQAESRRREERVSRRLSPVLD